MTSVVSLSPGPVMLMCLVNGVNLGAREQTLGMLGASVGNVLLMLLSALGVGALVHFWPEAFAVLGLLGAFYLIYLAWQIGVQHALFSPQAASPSGGHAFRRGLAVAVSNPKGILYFGALFPQFIDPAQALVAQFAVLTLSFLAIDCVVMRLYAVGGRFVTGWLSEGLAMVRLNRGLGLMMFLGGACIAWDQLIRLRS